MQHLLVWLLALIDAHLVRQIQFLKAENEILRSRLGLEVHTRPEERRRLLKFGLPLGGAVKHLISIVSYPTFRRWMRREGVPKPRRRRGRPRQPEEIEQLVVRMGRENAWGYSTSSPNSRTQHPQPVPQHGQEHPQAVPSRPRSPTRRRTWDDFLQRHLATLWACDLFTETVWTLWGRADCFILFFLEVGTRKIRFFNLTAHPTGEWMVQ